MYDSACNTAFEYGRQDWVTFEQGISKEWLLTNGIGGFASSTVTGANTRRYHGLLIASLEPPARRHLVLSKLDESIVVWNSDGGTSEHGIYTCATRDLLIRGFDNLQRFNAFPLPEYHFNVGGIFVDKTISLVSGKNTCVVVYRIYNSCDKSEFRITPLVNFRDYHHTMHKGHMTFTQEISAADDVRVNTGLSADSWASPDSWLSARTGAAVGTVAGKDEAPPVIVKVKPDIMDASIRMFCGGTVYEQFHDNWFTGMYYPAEAERGLDAVEDHFIPGCFKVSVGAGETKIITFIATIEDEMPGYDGPALQDAEAERIVRLAQSRSIAASGHGDIGGDSIPGNDPHEVNWFVRSLCRAADAFLVRRASTGMMTILAGYPWFMDWGRDAMIALPGLTLATGRFDVARDVLVTFASHMRDGLIPNLFPDDGGRPAYNTADAPLWFIEAAGRYAACTGDFEFIKRELYGKIKEVIENYAIGTDFDIGMDFEGLIQAGDENTQLTWMDTKVHGYAVTPRHGKPVELSALWYNALRTAVSFARRFEDDITSGLYTEISSRVKDSFVKRFWNEKAQCLYDVITKSCKDESIRPNQILAVSLTYPVLEGEKAKKVLLKVYKELYRTYGLRTLSPCDSRYIGVYTGNTETRDRAYHNGIVWTWLIGHFITAWSKVFGEGPEGSRMCLMFIRPFMDHIRDAGIGSISEIFDGDPPNKPRGCFAQAWSVAELLRVCSDLKLM